MKTIRLKDLVSEIQGNKNISQQKILRVINALPKVISLFLLNKKEVKFIPFVKFGFKNVKDRISKSSVTKEILHIPQHLRFKATFYTQFKDYLNEKN